MEIEQPLILQRKGSTSYKDVLSGKRMEANSYRIQERKGGFNSNKGTSETLIPTKNN